MQSSHPYIIWFSDPESADVAKVGGKNASLGEMIQKLHEAGIAVPAGFATSVAAYWEFVEANGLQKKIAAALDGYKQNRQTAFRRGSRRSSTRERHSVRPQDGAQGRALRPGAQRSPTRKGHG